MRIGAERVRHPGNLRYGSGCIAACASAELDNLLALCEGCHLHHDRHHHARSREARRIALLGMDPLFDLAAFDLEAS